MGRLLDAIVAKEINGLLGNRLITIAGSLIEFAGFVSGKNQFSFQGQPELVGNFTGGLLGDGSEGFEVELVTDTGGNLEQGLTGRWELLQFLPEQLHHIIGEGQGAG